VSTPLRLVCGGVAGLVAQTATYPLHVVRRRMQVFGDESAAHQLRYTKSAHGLRAVAEATAHIYRHEGIFGLYKGLTLSWMKAPVAVALSFTLNDKLKLFFREYNASHELDTQPTVGPTISPRKSGRQSDEIVSDHVESHDKEHLVHSLTRDSDISKEQQQGQRTQQQQPAIPAPVIVAAGGGVAEGGVSISVDQQRRKRGEQEYQLKVGGLSLSVRMFCGGVAGAVAKTVIAPMDRVKILYQVRACDVQGFVLFCFVLFVCLFVCLHCGFVVLLID
jgi:hypothetical protein